MILAFVIAFAGALAVTPLIARIATRFDIVDRPGPFKVHERPVPYLGGVAVFVAMAAVVGFERPSVLVPLGLALALGVADDVADLSPRVRLAGEVVVGAAGAVVIDGRGPVAAVATIGFVVVLVNAVNLLDGLDGLATGVAAAGAIGFAIVLGDSWSIVALALTGALIGFAAWNRPPARIYLGDAGSYTIGTALALLLAAAWGSGRSISIGAGALLFVAVPVADMTVAIVRRARARRPLFTGDRGHVYDQLVDRGGRPERVVVLCVLAQIVLTAIGVGIAAAPTPAALVIAAAVVIAVGTVLLRAFTAPDAWT
jgi:UDP-GlcNAc:undecaprenyl-phosphate/decaprenyl-phosphate GlcNAc-1-phosphate transferase